MIPGVRGRLITASFVKDVLPSTPGLTLVPPSTAAALESWAMRIEGMLGVTSSVRAIADVAVIPLLALLELSIEGRTDTADSCCLRVTAGRSTCLVFVTQWGEPLDRIWRSAIVSAIARDARWCLCCNGRALRVIDARHTWSREYLEFDAVLLGREPEAQSLLWNLVRADALACEPAFLDHIVELSRRHGVHVCRALGTGVLEALELLLATLVSRTQRASLPLLFEQSLTVLYRVLFLLFAEARGLLPIWHPVYRDRYSLDTIVTSLLSGQRYRGLWQAVQAISRLAHAGCIAGELRVTAFNGRLFSPSQAEAFDRRAISDTVMGQAVVALSTTAVTRRGGRARIVYRDLDVEQLGAVYERVLDFEPALDGQATLRRTRDVRKSSGTFYTPRAMTACLVRRTLEPLVQGRSAEEILNLRVLDPAMGSGAFLVAACRYLSASVEDAFIREGRWHAHDVTLDERAALRREVASRCLFGVDLNPMAVQLSRLSLWLATLAADKPLSFLDHHLVAGNSLVGAAPGDLARQPGGGARRTKRHDPLPLFERDDLPSVLEHAVRVRMQMTNAPDESASDVRDKERTLAALHAKQSSLGQWSRVLDLWCAGWFWTAGRAPDRGTFNELVAHLLDRRSALPAHLASSLLAQADDTATRCRFHHWTLAFPEVFLDESGHVRSSPGFDAVIGNPPWDMVRGDSIDEDAREHRRHDARRLTDFVRESGIYRVENRAHANLYQLFVERALHLVRPGGRIGLVLPSGLATDVGAAPLRRHLFAHADVDEITGLDNTEAIFPIHRSTRFILMTCTSGRPTREIRCRFGITKVDDLDTDAASSPPVRLARTFLERLSGEDDLGIPELADHRDLALVERISAKVPRLGDAKGWHVRFGRELNASDDRDLFVERTADSGGRPIVEGKQVEPFRVALDRSRFELTRQADTRLSLPRRARLAYRDVASATNRLTLIATIIPAQAVTTHTLFCLKTALPITDQQVLCALMNSFVANYLIRLRVNTHVTVALVSRLPVPLVRGSDRAFDQLAHLSRTLTRAASPVEHMQEYTDLQALCAHLYGLSADDFGHVLGTFPLIPEAVRSAALGAFSNLR